MQIPLTSDNVNDQLNTSTDQFYSSSNESNNFASIEVNKHEVNVEIKTIQNKTEIYISRKIRWFIFSIFMFLQIMMNVDHGTVPAATNEIREDLKIDDDILGIFASLVFLGNLIGSIMSISLINRLSRKILLVLSLFFNSVCLFTFAITEIRWILFMNRIFVGIFQAYIAIFLPVWCDQFGMGSKKSVMISMIQAGSTVGVVVGYFLTFEIKKESKWSFSFTLQSVIIMTIALIIAIIPSIYFSGELKLKKIKNSEKEKSNDNKENQSYKIEDDVECVFVYNDLNLNIQENENNLKEVLNTSEYFDKNSNNSSKTQKYYSNFLQNLRTIFSEKVFVFSTIALSTLFFVITAVQYWVTDYMQHVLNIKDTKEILLTFSIICITSPTLGLIMGGWACSMIGGYESKHSILLCFLFAFCAGPFSLLVTVANSLLFFSIFLWFVLFFGAAIFPTLTGIILSSLPVELRGIGNSINSLFANLFGYLPAPYVYGLINYFYKNQNERMAFTSIMTYPILCLVLISIATFFRYKKFEYLENKNKDEKSGSSKSLQRFFGGLELFDFSKSNKVEHKEATNSSETGEKYENTNKIIYNTEENKCDVNKIDVKPE